MSKLKAYPKYKDSGVEWLGEIPEGWEVKRLRHVASGFNNGTTVTQVDKETNYKVSRIETISDGTINYEAVGYAEKGTFKEEYLLNEGDLLLTHINSLDHVGKTAQYHNSQPLIHGMNLVRIQPLINKRFLYWFMTTNNFRYSVRRASKHAINQVSVSTSNLKNLPLALPEAKIQAKLAKYLDNRVNKIGGYVNKLKKEIELLKEYRQKIISQAVTCGLDENGNLREKPESLPAEGWKDSGVDWLGAIPEGWETRKLKYVCYYQEGPGIMAKDFRQKGVPLIRISGVKSSIVSLEGCNYLDPGKVGKTWVHYQLDKGDLLVSASASTEYVSEVGEEVVGAIPYTGIIRFKPSKEKFLKTYFKYLLLSDFYKQQVEVLKAGSAMQHYGPMHISKMYVLIPPKDEQAKVIELLKEKLKKVDEQIRKIQQQIEFMKEYKQSLISKVVTGKVDVREAKVNQP